MREEKLLDEIVQIFAFAKIICNQAFCVSSIDLEDLKERLKISRFSRWTPGISMTQLCEKKLLEHFHVNLQ